MSDQIHEIRKNGNIFQLAWAAITAYNRRTDSLSDGLHEIALALSTPQDNSAQIIELAARVRAMRDKLQSSIDRHKET